MTRTKKILILVLIVAILVVLWWWWTQKTGNEISVLDSGSNTQTLPTDNALSDNATTETPSNSPMSAEVVAHTFTERFGSFVNTDDFNGINLAQSLMTPQFADWALTGRKNDLREMYPRDMYGAEITKVLSTELVSDNSGVNDKVVNVRTQRTKTKSDATTVVYQTLKLELTLVEQQWLVNGAYWQPAE